MTQGARNNVNPLVPSTLDLDALIAEHTLDPVPFKLGGKTYQVRRDLTGPEIADYWRLVREQKDAEALAVLLKKPSTATAVALNKMLEKLPHQHMQLAVRKIMEAAGVVTSAGEAGESPAS